MQDLIFTFFRVLGSVTKFCLFISICIIMDGRLFEFVVSFCDGFGPSNVFPLDVLAANGFDPNVDHMKTIRVAFCEFNDASSGPMGSPSGTLSIEESQAYLKQYQVISLPSIVIRPRGEVDLTLAAIVVPVAHEPQHEVGAATTIQEDAFASAIAAYNDFNLADAIRRFEQVLMHDAHHKQALFNLASIFHMLGFPTLAVGYTVRLLTQDPEDTIAHSFLWALNNSGECTASAVEAYRFLASRGDLRAVTKLATLTGQGSQAARGDPQYAQQIYDDMGEAFESKLVDHLGYRGPWLMHEMLDKLVSAASNGTGGAISGECAVPRLRAKGDWRILDVGCGSGLCGDIFSEYVRQPAQSTESCGDAVELASLPSSPPPQVIPAAAAPPLVSLHHVPHTAGGLMVGIDVSAKMVEITARRGVYHCVERWDLTAALKVLDCTVTDGAYDTTVLSHTNPAQSAEVNAARFGLDMVIAADTFIYVGALGEVFSLVHKVLRSSLSADEQGDSNGDTTGGGLFMFSTEDLELSPMRVQTTANTSSEPADIQSVHAQDEVSDFDIPGAVPGWGAQLLSSARFAHSDRYVRMLCEKHHFRVLEHRKIVLRTEETIPLPGNIYILQKL